MPFITSSTVHMHGLSHVSSSYSILLFTTYPSIAHIKFTIHRLFLPTTILRAAWKTCFSLSGQPSSSPCRGTCMSIEYIYMRPQGSKWKGNTPTCSKSHAKLKVNMPKCGKYHSKWKLNTPTCRKSHTKWKVNMPKCGKYHATWQIQGPNRCKH